MNIIFLNYSLALAFILALGVFFASGGFAKLPNSHSSRNPCGTDTPIEAPGPNDAVLTVTNHFKVVQFTLESLRKLKTTQVSIFEPFVKARQNFTDSLGQLAIARFGASIPYHQAGPIRIIREDRSVLGKNINVWNWSLSVIRIK